MTIDSWRAAVGGSWSRLLLYPGGLTALLLALLLALLWRPSRFSSRVEAHPGLAAWWSILAVGAPLLAIGLLPLPSPAEMRVTIDLPALLLLLEVPILIVALDALRSPLLERQADGAVYLSGVLTAAPVLALLVAALASSSGTLLLAAPPEPDTRLLVIAVCWALVLPPLLQLMPWGAPLPARPALRLALHLRRAGHVALAALPWLSRWPEQLPGLLADTPTREKGTFLATFVLLALLLLLWSRLARRGDMRRWGMIYLAIALVLLALLLLQGAGALQQRLQ